MNAIAVLDVGKTNKKVLIYNQALDMLDSVYERFEADESGAVHIEPAEASAEWFLDRLRDFSKTYDIKAVSITTHGATWVGLDEEGRLAHPVMAYTTPVSEEWERAFYERFGSERQLHRELATPNLAMTNMAKTLAYAQEQWPDEFQRVRHILPLPQYFGYLLTGQYGAETTSVGCHSYLLDFERMAWSRMADELGIRALLPTTIHRPGDPLGTVTPDMAARTGLSEDTVVTYGLHDSNASLLPFLIREQRKFVLNSTGTWCVAMFPTDYTPLTEDEIDAKVFYNCDALGRPVKTANFMGGQERSFWAERIAKASGDDRVPDYKPVVLHRLLSERNAFILPGVMPGTGPFPKSLSRLAIDGTEYGMSDRGLLDVPCLKRPEEAFGLLSASLALQTYEQMVHLGVKDGMPIYVEGGFRKNRSYCALLTALFPHSQVLLTDLREATALGAALTAKALLEHKHLKALADEWTFTPDEVQPEPFVEIWNYRDAYLQRLR